jgi:hypothetical protein
MNGNLLEHVWSFLLKAPPYTSIFLLVQECEEPLLVMRVEELSLFCQTEYRASLSFETWCNTHGTWVVALPFRIKVCPQFSVEGMPCLNPRSARDAEIIRKFSRDETVRFLFLNANLSDSVNAEVAWPYDRRWYVEQCIQEMDHALIGEKLTSPFDPDFEQAKREFQSYYTVAKLLQG